MAELTCARPGAGHVAGPKHRPAIVVVNSVTRTFGSANALSDVSIQVQAGEIHALLGPNGAGKTTLLRLLSGAMTPTVGTIQIRDVDAATNSIALRRMVGVVASGDRTLYLRISALENLVFFGRLQGLSHRVARTRAGEALEQVGLTAHAHKAVNRLSHGMQKRVGFARALLTKPCLLLIDEATHDLDPEASERLRDLARSLAADGAALVWATQRLDEINAFADNVTMLDEGIVRFAGSVSQFASLAESRRYVLDLRNGHHSISELNQLLTGRGRIEYGARSGYLLAVAGSSTLGQALAAIENGGVGVLDCREERSRLEGVFLALTGGMQR